MSDILSRNRSKPSDNLELIYELEQLCHDIRSITGNNKKIATRQYTIRERLVNSVQNAYA